ncbi:MAG: LON peptidase substrate-binding domain-containing protein, partial [Clostridia bacterium]|nr:LON peptidase substrate-binding domain-containing protein [Clostridia bacterium]
MANKRYRLPLIPIRGLTVFPGMVIHFDVGREKSIAAVESAISADRLVVLSYQRDSLIEKPTREDISNIGVLAEIRQILRIPDGSLRVLIEGIARVKITGYYDDEKHTEVRVVEKSDIPAEDYAREQALMRRVNELVRSYFDLYEKINPQALSSLAEIQDGGELADIAASNFPLKPSDQQIILEELDVEKRLEKLIELMESESKILEVEQ